METPSKVIAALVVALSVPVCAESETRDADLSGKPQSRAIVMFAVSTNDMTQGIGGLVGDAKAASIELERMDEDHRRDVERAERFYATKKAAASKCDERCRNDAENKLTRIKAISAQFTAKLDIARRVATSWNGEISKRRHAKNVTTLQRLQSDIFAIMEFDVAELNKFRRFDSTGTIRGTVTTAGAAAQTATVTIDDLKGNPFNIKTDGNGKYRQPGLPPGRYEVVASLPFNSQLRTATLTREERTAVVDFELEP